jgi:hypothetical protein
MFQCGQHKIQKAERLFPTQNKADQMKMKFARAYLLPVSEGVELLTE